VEILIPNPDAARRSDCAPAAGVRGRGGLGDGRGCGGVRGVYW